MSSETIAWAKEQTCGNPVTKAVLLEIANWARPNGVCEYLSVRRIAEVVEVSVRTVQRHIALLESTDVTRGGLGADPPDRALPRQWRTRCQLIRAGWLSAAAFALRALQRQPDTPP